MSENAETNENDDEQDVVIPQNQENQDNHENQADGANQQHHDAENNQDDKQNEKNQESTTNNEDTSNTGEVKTDNPQTVESDSNPIESTSNKNDAIPTELANKETADTSQQNKQNEEKDQSKDQSNDIQIETKNTSNESPNKDADLDQSIINESPPKIPKSAEITNDLDDISPSKVATVIVKDDKCDTHAMSPDQLQPPSSPTGKTANVVQSQSPELSPNHNHELNNPDGFGPNFDWKMFNENRSLKETNRELVKKTKENEAQIVSLEDALATLHEELKFLEGQEVQAVAKQLAKKNRTLAVQLERERTKSAQLQIENNKLKSELQGFAHLHVQPKKMVEPIGFSRKDGKMINGNTNSTTNSIDIENKHNNIGTNNNTNEFSISNTNSTEIDKMYKDRYNKVSTRLTISRNEIKILKNENMTLKLALKKEIGFARPINDILNDTGNWKGRAEKISLLQSKIQQLKHMIQNSNISHSNLKMNNTITSTPSLMQKASVDRLHYQGQNADRQSDLACSKSNSISINRHGTHVYKQLSHDFQTTKTELESMHAYTSKLKEQLRGKNSRIKSLEMDSGQLRRKIDFLLKKSQTDDELIDKLQNQVENKIVLETTLKKRENRLTKVTSSNQELLMQIESLGDQLDKSKKLIHSLQSKLDTMTEQRTKSVETMFSKFNNDEKTYQMQILNSEVSQLKEIIEMNHNTIEQLSKKLSKS